MHIPSPKVLDCTFRDGGYYNNWEFPEDVVNAYLSAMAASGVNYVELGFRNYPSNEYLGAFAYTTDSYLDSISLPEGPIYGVMVDAKTLLQETRTVPEAVGDLFKPANESKVGLVRVAAHFRELEQCGPIVKALKALGYIVGFNLMQSGGKPNQDIQSAARLISSWDSVDILYFADSLGDMDKNEVSRITSQLQENWEGDLGIHTHDNMGRALDNTLTALDLGVSFLDCTITGMGRGAGNAQTENLLTLLSEKGYNFAPNATYEVVIKQFAPMKKECGWGSNLLYFIGAQHSIHPTYIQRLLSSTHYGQDEIIGAISYLASNDHTASFDGEILELALGMNASFGPVGGSDKLKSIFKDKEVMILAGGDSTSQLAKDIINYIKAYQPVVISINVNKAIPENYVDYYCIIHNSKFLSQSSLYSQLTSPIIAPLHRFSSEEIKALGEKIEIIDYGVEIIDGNFNVSDQFCTIPFELTAAYAMAIANIGQADQISLIGFDGFDSQDKRQLEMIELFNIYSQSQTLDAISLTKTTYPITQSSIYAPKI